MVYDDSDIFSRVLDFTKFDIIYGAQRKYGSSWNYFSDRKEEILGKSGRTIPSI
jgi:phosphoserine aminotransferase